MKKLNTNNLISRLKKGSLPSLKIGSFHNLGYRVLGNAPSKYFPFSNSIRKSLNKIHFRMSHIIYISSMFFWVLLSMVFAAIISFPLTYFLVLLNILEEN